MRICVVKATGKVVEMQSDATEGTLISNQVNVGYLASDIEERIVTEAEYLQLIEDQKPEEVKDKEERNSLIKNKKEELAIAELIAEGKLNVDGALKK